MKIKKVDSIDQLNELKTQYLSKTTAPLDGMWLTGFVPIASHFGFYNGEKLIGFFCINDDGYVLQFHTCHHMQRDASTLFDLILTGADASIPKVKGAFASTAEPQYFSHCLDSFAKFKVNALMYQLNSRSEAIGEQNDATELTVVNINQLAELVQFAKDSIGAPEEWLTGYYTNLINRKELLGHWQNDKLLAAGECRCFDDYQTDYADLGVIVAKSERGRGLATKVLKQLVIIAESMGLNPICSTEKDNIGAQKAIIRAGFYSSNRIVQFDL